MYHMWTKMRSRCRNPKDVQYHNYGAKGVTIAEKWDDYGTFRTYLVEELDFPEPTKQDSCT